MGFPELRSSVNFRGLRPRDPSAAFGASSSSEWGVSESRWEMLEVPNQDFKPFKNWFHGYISCLFLLYASIYIYIYTSRYITYILVIFHVNLCIYIYTHLIDVDRCPCRSIDPTHRLRQVFVDLMPILKSCLDDSWSKSQGKRTGALGWNPGRWQAKIVKIYIVPKKKVQLCPWLISFCDMSTRLWLPTYLLSRIWLLNCFLWWRIWFLFLLKSMVSMVTQLVLSCFDPSRLLSEIRPSFGDFNILNPVGEVLSSPQFWLVICFQISKSMSFTLVKFENPTSLNHL